MVKLVEIVFGNKRFEVEECRSWFSKFRGLMFSRRRNLLFVFDKEKRVDLHMFFVFFYIDVYFFDENFKVIDLKKRVKPFSLIKCDKKCKYVLEVSKGNFDLKVGNKINCSIK